MSTRPRISFDVRGWCNACVWSGTKKTLDWEARLQELTALLNRHRRTNGNFDCIVPVSGGKDGSYVSYNLKYKYGMSPLAVTVTPPLPSAVGENNLREFIARGYNHISINPDYEMMRRLNKAGFIDKGSPYHGWLCTIMTAVIQLAVQLNIPLIFYGEDGEVEYGGDMKNAERPTRDLTDHDKHYFSGMPPEFWAEHGISPQQLEPFRAPPISESQKLQTEIHFFSYYKYWDPQANFYYCTEHTGFSPNPERTQGPKSGRPLRHAHHI